MPTPEADMPAEATPPTDAPTSALSEPAMPSSQASDPSETTQRPSPVLPDKQDCGRAETQQAMNRCAQQNYRQSDDALNDLYQTVRADLSEAAEAKLIEAEQAWLDFRDQNCDFERSQFEGGSLAPLIHASCLEQLTDERLAELQQPSMPETAYEQVDQQLNQTYQALQTVLSESEQAQLTDVQQTWL
ncbi:MAG: DUF1311 domain-containing protein, partial [Leptolyngbya sp. SIO4C1]|nr:DUF1311 domain-containing protein [Leptolyngbya sp. SIO4C1]